MTTRLLPLLAALAIAWLPGCGDTPATPAQCAAILDRIIEIELAAQGYRDPAMLERIRRESRTRYAGRLDDCKGRRLPEGAMECVATARDIETLIHTCLHHSHH